MSTELLQTLETIMKYYVWTVVIMTPFTILLMIYLYKKTHFFEAIDSIIDKVLKIDSSKDKSKGDKDKTEDKNLKIDDSVPQEETENETDYIKQLKDALTVINLKVGDSYKCVANSLQKKLLGISRNWKIDNEFIGKIETSTGVFKAEKTGWGVITCNDEMMYFIEVHPKNEKWEFEEMFKDVISPSDISIIRLRYMRKMYVPISYNLKNFKSVFAQPVIGGRKCTCVFDKNKNVIKCVMELPYSTDMMNTIIEGMKERMELISKQKSPEKFWISMGRDDSSEDVMFIAFLQKKKNTNRYIFGLGISWKECDRDEVLSNPGMITRFFADCLDKEDLPQSIITIAEKKADKEEASSEKGSVEQTDNAIHDGNRTNNDNEATVGNEQKDASQETSASQKEDSTTVTTEPNAETVSTTDEKQDIQNSGSNEDNEGDKGNENREYSEDDAFETALFNENSSDYLPEDDEKETLDL